MDYIDVCRFILIYSLCTENVKSMYVRKQDQIRTGGMPREGGIFLIGNTQVNITNKIDLLKLTMKSTPGKHLSLTNSATGKYTMSQKLTGIRSKTRDMITTPNVIGPSVGSSVTHTNKKDTSSTTTDNSTSKMIMTSKQSRTTPSSTDSQVMTSTVRPANDISSSTPVYMAVKLKSSTNQISSDYFSTGRLIPTNNTKRINPTEKSNISNQNLTHLGSTESTFATELNTVDPDTISRTEKSHLLSDASPTTTNIPSLYISTQTEVDAVTDFNSHAQSNHYEFDKISTSLEQTQEPTNTGKYLTSEASISETTIVNPSANVSVRNETDVKENNSFSNESTYLSKNDGDNASSIFMTTDAQTLSFHGTNTSQNMSSTVITELTLNTTIDANTSPVLNTSSNIEETTMLLNTTEQVSTAYMVTIKTTTNISNNENSTYMSRMHIEQYRDGDDTYWPIAMAVTIAVPTIIVVGVTITAIHKKRKLDRAHSSLAGYITPPVEYDV